MRIPGMTRSAPSFALAFLTVAGLVRGEDPPTNDTTDASIPAATTDVVLAVDVGEGPRTLRATFAADGRPLASVWEIAFANLTAFVDVDGNGSLNEAEAERLPSVVALRETLALGFAPNLGPTPDWADLDADDDGDAEPAEVAAFYRRNGVGRPTVAYVTLPLAGELTNALIEQLDFDDDGRVTSEELDGAAGALGKLDTNDDELIGAGELVPGILYPGAAGGVSLEPKSPIPPSGGPTAAVVRLIPSASSSAASTIIEVRRSAAFDVRPEIAVASVRDASDSTHDESGIRIAVRSDRGRLGTTFGEVVEHYESAFAIDDSGDAGAVSLSEIDDARQAVWRPLSVLIDRDSDGRLTRAELNGWLSIQRNFVGAQAHLSVLVAEDGLFEAFDADHDGGLSSRELGRAAKSLDDLGTIHEGVLDRTRIPTQVFLVVSHGYPSSPLGEVERSGPAWFRAMDRNSDGDVSRREFAERAEIFARLDRDGDGLISPAEAESAKP